MKTNTKKKIHCGECGTPLFASRRGVCETCGSMSLVERVVCAACERLLNSIGQCGACPQGIMPKCFFCETRGLVELGRESKENETSEFSSIIAVLDITSGMALLSFLEISKGEMKHVATLNDKKINGIEVNKIIAKAFYEGYLIGELIIMAPDNLKIKNNQDLLGRFFKKQIGKKDLCQDCLGVFFNQIQCGTCKIHFKWYLGECPGCSQKRVLSGVPGGFEFTCKMCGKYIPKGFCPSCLFFRTKDW